MNEMKRIFVYVAMLAMLSIAPVAGAVVLQDVSVECGPGGGYSVLMQGEMVQDREVIKVTMTGEFEFSQGTMVQTGPGNNGGIMEGSGVISRLWTTGPDIGRHETFNETFYSNGITRNGCQGVIDMQVTWDTGEVFQRLMSYATGIRAEQIVLQTRSGGVSAAGTAFRQ